MHVALALCIWLLEKLNKNYFQLQMRSFLELLVDGLRSIVNVTYTYLYKREVFGLVSQYSYTRTASWQLASALQLIALVGI